MELRVLNPEEIQPVEDTVLKNYTEVNNKAGQRFISGEITYDEYKKIVALLCEAYEGIYRDALLNAQFQFLIKAFVEWLGTHNRSPWVYSKADGSESHPIELNISYEDYQSLKQLVELA